MKNKITRIGGVLLLCTILSLSTVAQMPTDGFMMPKGNICIVGMYSRDVWNKYWEGTLKRDNQNIGTMRTNSADGMLAFGIFDKLLFTANVPYIWTNSSRGHFTGQHGFQDLALGLKWKVVEGHIPGGKLSFQASAVGTIPMSKYVPDFLPYSIGIQSKTASLNAIIHYMTDKKIYLTMQWGYVRRDNITIDRAFYYTDRMHNTNQVFIPDLIVYGAQLGFEHEHFRAEAWASVQISQAGSDIRPYDMPFPGNSMSFTKAGLTGKYHFMKVKNLTLTASGGYTFAGRNVGQSVFYNAGVQYIIKCY